MAHKTLSIDDMISIEKETSYISRKKFNRPYHCVEIEEGETTQVLPNIDIEKKESIVWFDYDSGIEGPVWDDIDFLIRKAKNGSVIIITLNANNHNLSNLAGSKENKEKVKILKQLVGDYLPKDFSPKSISRRKYPALLANIVLNKFKSSQIASGRDEEFIPIYNFFYQDNSPMITLGGMLVDNDGSDFLQESGIFEIPFVTQEKQYDIDVPPLTMKEKKAIDQLLPNEKISNKNILDILDFKLKEKQIKAYREFYKYYPLYGELQV
jgi:hypothetical protein